MIFALAIAFLVLSGLALLRLLQLGTGHRATDLALAWLAGSGAFALAAPLVRFGMGIPLSRATALALVLLPPAAWVLRRRRRGAPLAAGDAGREVAGEPREGPGSGSDAEQPGEARLRGGDAASRAARAEGSPGPGDGGAGGPDRRPLRPGWLPGAAGVFAPMAAYVVIVTVVVLFHGVNTPTNTDDGVRVRAFAPMLAFADGWEPEAREVLVTAGALPTFVPALGWIATGTVDHFHVNYFVLAELIALLVLVVALCSSRGQPERGWASAFAILSIPLFVYHCTSTYADAVLAMRVAGGVLFATEYARTRAASDASRALLLLGLAALVKREGELVAAAPAAVLVAQFAWERSRGAVAPWRSIAALAAPLALGALGKIAAVGVGDAFPMLGLVARESAAAAAPAVAAGRSAAAAAFFVEHALFRSGNAGMIYWVLAATIVVRARALLGAPATLLSGTPPARAGRAPVGAETEARADAGGTEAGRPSRPEVGGTHVARIEAAQLAAGPMIRTRKRARSPLLWPLAAVLALLAEVAVSSIWLVPEFTLDESTVHRALMVASVPAALWIVAALTEAAREEVAADAPASAGGGRDGEKARPPRRRRRRRASRR